MFLCYLLIFLDAIRKVHDINAEQVLSICSAMFLNLEKLILAVVHDLGFFVVVCLYKSVVFYKGDVVVIKRCNYFQPGFVGAYMYDMFFAPCFCSHCTHLCVEWI